jgi:hypothetical protein
MSLPLLNIDYSLIPELPNLKWNDIDINPYTTTYLEDLQKYYGRKEISIEDRLYSTPQFLKEQLDRFPKEISKLILTSYFIDYIFVDKIQEEIKYYCKINDNITIYSQNKSFNSLEAIWYVFHIINQISKLKVSKEHQIHLIPIDIEKKLREDNKFSYININSGVCYNHRTIIVWRKEEMSKVLCHEMIHMLNIDYQKDIIHLDGLAEKLFMINENMDTIENESTTECLTVYVMCHINSYFIKHEVNESHIRKLLDFEMKWTCKQMKKIWKYLTSNNIIFETDIISYFFIKGLLLFRLLNYPDFYKYLFHSLEQFSDTELNSLEIRKGILNLDFLDKFETYFNKVEEDSTDSLRMTFCSK